MKALRRAGWSVHVVAEWEYVPMRWKRAAMKAIGRATRSVAVREFNEALLSWATKFQPELLLVFKGMFVQRDTLRELRQRGVRAYCFYPDVSFHAHGPYLPSTLPEYDWVFTTKTFGLADMREQLGITRASVLPHAFDPDLHRPVHVGFADLERYGCDVSYIGTWSPKKEAVLSELAAQRPALRLRVWGEQWRRARSAPLRNAIVGYEVIGEEYVRAICSSAINLGILSERRLGASEGDRITSRTFHIPACEGFLLHERTDEVKAVFAEGREIACYDGCEELLERVDSFLRDAELRRAIARQGREVVAAAHSWDHRIQDVLARHAILRHA
jgi:hypothetical protein